MPFNNIGTMVLHASLLVCLRWSYSASKSLATPTTHPYQPQPGGGTMIGRDEKHMMMLRVPVEEIPPSVFIFNSSNVAPTNQSAFLLPLADDASTEVGRQQGMDPSFFTLPIIIASFLFFINVKFEAKFGNIGRYPSDEDFTHFDWAIIRVYELGLLMLLICTSTARSLVKAVTHDLSNWNLRSIVFCIGLKVLLLFLCFHTMWHDAPSPAFLDCWTIGLFLGLCRNVWDFTEDGFYIERGAQKKLLKCILCCHRTVDFAPLVLYWVQNGCAPPYSEVCSICDHCDALCSAFTTKPTLGEARQEERCPICLDDFGSEIPLQDVLKLPCGHLHCRACMMKRFELQQNDCSCCRQNILAEETRDFKA